jgi:hypothetical protein
MYNKTLRTRNLQKIDRFCSKLVSFLFSVTNTLSWTDTLAYYRIYTLQIRHVLWYRSTVSNGLTMAPHMLIPPHDLGQAAASILFLVFIEISTYVATVVFKAIFMVLSFV